MAKKKKEEIIGNVKLVCHKWKWAGFKESCDRILSIQNCMNFFGDFQPCECFEIKELDIKDRELEKIEKMINETQDPQTIERQELEISIPDNSEPPIEYKPKKKRRRRKKRADILENLD